MCYCSLTCQMVLSEFVSRHVQKCGYLKYSSHFIVRMVCAVSSIGGWSRLRSCSEGSMIDARYQFCTALLSVHHIPLRCSFISRLHRMRDMIIVSVCQLACTCSVCRCHSLQPDHFGPISFIWQKIIVIVAVFSYC